MLLWLLLLQIVVIMIRYNTIIPSLSCTYKALISTTKSTISYILDLSTSRDFSAFVDKTDALFFARLPPNNILPCAAGSPAPQAEKFSLAVHLWVKLQATQVNLPHAFQCARAYLIKDLLVLSLVSASLRHFLTVRRTQRDDQTFAKGIVLLILCLLSVLRITLSSSSILGGSFRWRLSTKAISGWRRSFFRLLRIQFSKQKFSSNIRM